ncbi:MAG: hypothetical protein LBR68_03565 [Lachnoclostridium sp.]|jgi:hypothetical protein|nr:hypothetical protein [Lachnoclostridium sp.]
MGSIKNSLSRHSATNLSLNQKSLRILSSLRDIMQLLRIDENRRKK